LLVGVFGDDVFIEEAEGAFVRRGGKADQAGIKVVEYLLPQVVDAAVAFIDDDEIESLDGYSSVVAHQLFLFDGLLHFVERDIFSRFINRLTYRAEEDTDSILSSFRNDYNPRIAVTVDMIATGTDVKPLEVLLFMRDVRSKGYCWKR
jgi:hypothetical protein